MSKRIYYVYILSRPWNDVPCYVGKGHGKRWQSHEWLGERHNNKHLAHIFKKASRLGLHISRVKVKDNLTEEQSFKLERRLIKKIGRGKKGPLVNLTAGGEGSSGWIAPKSSRKRMSIAGKQRWSLKRERELQSFRLKNSWADPKRKKQGKASAAKMWANIPFKRMKEISELRSKNAKKQWKDLGRRQRLKQKAIARWSNPEFRLKCSKAQVERWAKMPTKEKEALLNKLSQGQQRRYASSH